MIIFTHVTNIFRNSNLREPALTAANKKIKAPRLQSSQEGGLFPSLLQRWWRRRKSTLVDGRSLILKNFAPSHHRIVQRRADRQHLLPRKWYSRNPNKSFQSIQHQTFWVRTPHKLRTRQRQTIPHSQTQANNAVPHLPAHGILLQVPLEVSAGHLLRHNRLRFQFLAGEAVVADHWVPRVCSLPLYQLRYGFEDQGDKSRLQLRCLDFLKFSLKLNYLKKRF